MPRIAETLRSYPTSPRTAGQAGSGDVAAGGRHLENWLRSVHPPVPLVPDGIPIVKDTVIHRGPTTITLQQEKTLSLSHCHFNSIRRSKTAKSMKEDNQQE